MGELSHARIHVALVFGLALTACTEAPSDTQLDVVFDVCQPITVSAPGADAARLAGIEEGLASWRARGVDALMLDAADVAPGAIEIRFEDAAPAFHGYYDDERGIVYLNTDLANTDQLAVTVAHELGHAFGLWHVSADTRASVMNPGNLSIVPTADDAAALFALWGTCAPITARATDASSSAGSARRTPLPPSGT